MTTVPKPVDVLNAKFRRPSDAVRLRAGTVEAVAAGLVTVALAGGSVEAPHLASYSPAVGDVVLLLQTSSQVLIIGTPA